MSTLYTQDSSPTNPFGVGWHEQAVDTSRNLIKAREADEERLLAQLNDGPYSFSARQEARNAVRALEANPAADPAALAAARAKFEEVDSKRSALNAQYEQNAGLLERTREGLITNENKLAEARLKATNQPADRPIVNAGDDPAANSAPPVVSPENITGTTPPLNVTTPAVNSPTPVPPSLAGDNGGFVTNAQGELIPSDSEEAEEIRAEQNRIEAEAAAPQREFVVDPNTGEFIPTDSAQAEEIRAEQNRVQTDAPAPVAGSTQSEGDAGEAEAQAALQGPDPVPPNLTTAWDPETGSYGVWDEDKGVFIETGLTEEEAAQAANDPFEAARLAREKELGEELPEAFGPEPVPGNFVAVWDPATESWGVFNADTGEFESTGLTEQEAQLRAENLSLGSDEPIPQGTPGGTGLTEEEQQAKDEAAAKANAINQATRQSVYKQGGSSDWRVRLQLAPTSNYLYNQPQGQRGILDPLFYTNGVIFPYTPQIQTNYQAKYTDYDLVHSNFRGVFYQSSRVDDINIRAEFTAQDTNEANYLLAVIHFFRSVTKMFYGKDTERGTPPPLVYLSGLGMDQFYGHPCLVRSFQYALPNNVDYIRATNVNNYGTDLLNRRKAGPPASTAGLGATGNRILNAGLEKFFPAAKPAPNTVVAQVNNMQLANYVPTKMEIDIVLIPVQTRSQVSKQFSLKGFANGDLIRNGFW